MENRLVESLFSKRFSEEWDQEKINFRTYLKFSVDLPYEHF